jgi:hypothetical protein
MSEGVYYEKPVLLDREKHRDLRVASSHAFGFASRANSLYLAAAEFAQACKEYAIVFTRAGSGKIAPAAVLGLRERENLFVDDKQRWTGNYVPAFVRRYPFVLAELPDKSMGVCIDEAFEGIGYEDGEALFDDAGNNTPFLQRALDFLNRYQQEYRRTEGFCERLERAGLLREMDAMASLVDGRNLTVGGLLVVDEQKLLALPDSAVLSLFRAGELHLISMHLVSLANMRRLVDRMAQRGGPLPAPAPTRAPA